MYSWHTDLESTLRTTDVVLKINTGKGKICAESYVVFSLSENK